MYEVLCIYMCFCPGVPVDGCVRDTATSSCKLLRARIYTLVWETLSTSVRLILCRETDAPPSSSQLAQLRDKLLVHMESLREVQRIRAKSRGAALIAVNEASAPQVKYAICSHTTVTLFSAELVDLVVPSVREYRRR